MTGHGRSSRCEKTRRLLWPRDLPREYVEGEMQARRHLEGCYDCRRFFRGDESLAVALRRHGSSRREAPRGLRERVYDALAHERAVRAPAFVAGRPSPGADAHRGGSTLAGAVLALSGFVALLVAAGDTPSADAYVHDFTSRAVEEDVIRTSDPATVASFFMKEIGVGLTPVPFEEADLSRAMICLIRGERAAMVEYRWRGRTVAHYRLPLASRARAAAARTPLWWLEQRGVKAIRWVDGGFEHALVSELPVEELVRLARSRFPGL